MNVHIQDATETQIRSSMRPANIGAGLERLAWFAERARELDDVMCDLTEQTGENTSRAVSRLRTQLAEFEPSVTILGQVKSGKTTLVNAMAGWADLLPSDVNPWTSVITSLHMKPAAKPAETGARFRFMTEEEWDQLVAKGGRIGELASRAGAEGELQKITEQIRLVHEKARQRLGKKFELMLGDEHEYGFFDKNLLENYICLGDDFDHSLTDDESADQGRFADIVRSADLFLNSTTVPYALCLRDTPGVNDTFLMREQITIQAIRNSRLCVVVLSAGQALTSVDMGLIRLISNIKSRDVLIFVNRIDELSDPVNQIKEIEESIRSTLKTKGGPEDAEIIFGSAYWANKVLSGDIEGISEASKQCLFKWAEAALDLELSESQPHEMVWELSGIANLFRALSRRIVEGTGLPLLKNIAESAITVASSQKAVGMLKIEASEPASGISTASTLQEFDRIAEAHLTALQSELDDTVRAYHARADRAHLKFIQRALQSLMQHLDRHGRGVVWGYDPTSLRLLLKSAYSVLGARVRTLAEHRYEAAMTDVAVLYARAFGPSVEGIELSPPIVPDLPEPVSLGQSIALDFNDGWWLSWWTRMRGFRMISEKFEKLIHRETESFVTQMKSDQVEIIRARTTSSLTDFFEQHKDIIKEISIGPNHGADLQELFLKNDEAERKAKLEDIMTRLRVCLEAH